MKILSNYLKLAAAALVVVLSLTSCSKSMDLKLELKSEEGFRPGSEVAVNGHPAGKVNSIIEQDGQRFVLAHITDGAAIKVLREGTDREKPFLLNLSTRFVPVDAPPLSSGAIIRLRTPVERITKPATQFLDEAVVWVRDNPFEICLGVGGIVFVLCLIRGAFRRIGLTLIIAACISSVTSAETGVVYTKSYFVGQQAQLRTTLKDAEALLARAGRLGEAGATNDVAEAIVTASLILDSVEITLADFPKKLDQLKTAPLSYSRSEEQKRLLTNYSELVDNYRMLDERATVMRKETVGQAALAREYIRTHELSRAKIKDGVTTAILLAELKATTASSTKGDQALVIVVTNTVLERMLPAPVLPPITNWVTETRTNVLEKTVTNTVMATNTLTLTNFQTVTVTNMVSLTNEPSPKLASVDLDIAMHKPGGGRADAGRTFEEKSRAGEIDRAENSLPEPVAEVLDEPPLASKALTKGLASAPTSAVGSRRSGSLLAWPLVGVGATAALSALIAAMWLVGRARQPWVAAIHDCARGRRLEIALDNPDEVVALRGDKEPQALSRHVLDEGTARIIRNWRGRAVLVSEASAKVSVNGRPASAKVLLAEGDQISLAGASGERIYKFEAAEFLDNQADAALPESTT